MAVAFVVAAVYFYLISRRIWGGNSDVATPLLQGQAMAEGHLTLNGWNFIHDSFWTVDVLLYTVGYLVMGIDPELMFIVPALVAATILALSIRLVTTGLGGAAAWVSAVAVVALIGMPTQGWTFLFISIYGHPATLLFGLVAFAALRRPGGAVRWLVAVIFLTLGMLGDLQILPLAVGPIFGAGIVAMMRTRTLRAGSPLVAAALAAPVLSYLVRQVAEQIGTYGIAPSNPTATSEQMMSNVVHLPQYLAWAFGSGTTLSGTVGVHRPHDGLLGRLILDGEIRVVAVVLVSVAVVFAVYRTASQALRGVNRSSEDSSRRADYRIDDMLAIACVGDVVFFTVASLADESAYTRYVASFVIFGSILAARQLGRLWASGALSSARRPVLIAGAALVLLFGVSSTSALAGDVQPITHKTMTEFIADKGLHRGVGMFWDANQSTVASSEDVVIRAVQVTPTGFIPRSQLSRDTWYREPFEFVLCGPEPFLEGVSCQNAINAFGEPAKRYTYKAKDIGWRQVLVWDEPITISY
jgi:hypothetical protein